MNAPPDSSLVSVARAKKRSSPTSPRATARVTSAFNSTAHAGDKSARVSTRHARVNPGPLTSTCVAAAFALPPENRNAGTAPASASPVG